jgi:pimeloyl-ACP methyl ester carboxylesterase
MTRSSDARIGPRATRRAPVIMVCLIGGVLAACAGCFNQRSFPMRRSDLQAYELASSSQASPSAVEWLVSAHGELKHLLPRGGADALLTGDLAPGGHPIDVFAHFGLNPTHLHSVLFNLNGLMNTAQVTSGGSAIDTHPPDWDGFRDIWVPINPELQLAGRLGLAMVDGKPRVADCIVLVPGLLGDNGLWRTRDIATALRDSGLHVLALELRGYGQTEARYPNTYYCYGLLETGDLLAVAEWLQAQAFVRETGLIGFSWGANQALLLAWEDGREDDDPSVPPGMRSFMRPRNDLPHYRAGVIAFSPVVAFESLLDKLTRNWSMLADPVLSSMQAGLRKRWARKQSAESNGDLRRLVEFEARRAGLTYPGAMDDGFTYLRLLPYGHLGVNRKLEHARIPVLVVQGANDPLGRAQAVCDLFAGMRNPNVAALILPGGGHNGFPAYARSYFYNLILHFFEAHPGGPATLPANYVRRD